MTRARSHLAPRFHHAPHPVEAAPFVAALFQADALPFREIVFFGHKVFFAFNVLTLSV
jgi:hypothetical protein